MRERERERERENRNTTLVQNRKDEKECMHEECMNM